MRMNPIRLLPSVLIGAVASARSMTPMAAIAGARLAHARTPGRLVLLDHPLFKFGALAMGVGELFGDQARLRQRINELPAVQARLVRMSYFEAKSHSEIAEAIGMPLGTVKSHLRRAFLQLQAKVGGAL